MGPLNQHVDEKNAVAGWGWGPGVCGGGSCPAGRPDRVILIFQRHLYLCDILLWDILL
jgi:hypothetical protein